MIKTVDTDSLTLAGAKMSADLTGLVTELTVDCSTGSVAQLSITALDTAGTVAASPLSVPGTALTWRGDIWTVAAITTTWGDDATVVHAFDARSTLARKLRRNLKASAEHKVSPSAWVKARVHTAGGTAVCQPSSKQGLIAQTSGKNPQSALDVIGSLAGDLDWTWLEWGGRLYFGHRHWAWQGHAAGARLWPASWRTADTSDVLSAELTLDTDDTGNVATGTVTVPYDSGVRVRPWDRLQLTGFGKRNGVWLVDSLSFTADTTTPITLAIAQPRKPTKKAGSTA